MLKFYLTGITYMNSNENLLLYYYIKYKWIFDRESEETIQILNKQQ
jgi:hypothetical protein